ncbi:MAG: PTS transporter subunit EIIA [Lentisphaerae bacterium]|jgi:mannitol/fructose-specific phosphotransferase system IIA component (Ntr-type)|nr:PTS transporter subunit EIIA [Lentisphaerota bacterium]
MMWQKNFTFLAGLSDHDWLARIITPQQVVLDLQADDHESACRELIDKIIPASRQGDRERCLTDVLEREKVTSTFLGHGVALPHGITNGTDSIQVAIGIKPKGFPSGSDQSVKIILLCLCPPEQRREYLHFIFLAANVLLLEDNRSDLLKAITPEQACDVMLRI